MADAGLVQEALAARFRSARPSVQRPALPYSARSPNQCSIAQGRGQLIAGLLAAREPAFGHEADIQRVGFARGDIEQSQGIVRAARVAQHSGFEIHGAEVQRVRVERAIEVLQRG